MKSRLSLLLFIILVVGQGCNYNTSSANQTNPLSTTCSENTIKTAFFDRCKYLGVTIAESNSGQANKTTIESICRCAIIRLKIDAQRPLLNSRCEYEESSVMGIMKTQQIKLNCGSLW